jgi:hypothetical protein
VKVRLSIVALTLAACAACSRDGYRLAGFKRPDGSTIVFDVRKGRQRLEASCRADSPDCSNLMFKAGSSLDCYAHSSEGLVPYSYGAKIDAHANEGAGLVCHYQDGHGKLTVWHTQSCVDAKLVPLPPLSEFSEHSLPMFKVKIGGKDVEWSDYEYSPEFKKEHPAGTTAHESYDRGRADSPFLGLRAYVPAAFNEEQVRQHFIWLRKLDTVSVDSDGTITTPWQAPYNEYQPATDNSLRFCKQEKNLYFNESGKEVGDDTVLLTIVESSRVK